MTRADFKKKAAKIPDAPGVYFFMSPRREVMYIGKATSLRDRLRSYFAADIAEVRSPFIAQMITRAKTIDWRETDSVLDALMLEASLIKTHKPKYNTDLKDDKSWNHVVITKEPFPRVLLVRARVIADEWPAARRLKVFGPFPHGLQLKEALTLVRKIFPYRDTCMPQTGRRCFNAQIGLCPGVCSGEVSAREYKKTIRHLTLLFEGKKPQLMKLLEREMKAAAKKEAFEEAVRLRKKISALKHIQDVSLIKDEYKQYQSSGMRIEAYDAAHLQGSSAVGVLAVVEDGEARPAEYRKFRLRRAKPGDDVGALKEILSRRLAHDEWPMPKLIVVDGSKAQMNGAAQVLADAGVRIPIVGVVKDEKHRPKGVVGEAAAYRGREYDILRANAEAHRFAIAYHRKRSRAERGIL